MLDYNRLPDEITEDSVVTLAVIDLASHLPAYKTRAIEYLHNILETDRPDIILIQGASINNASVISNLANDYYLHSSPNNTSLNYANVSCISREYSMITQSEIRITTHDGMDIIPDCLVDEFNVKGNIVRVYNYEAPRGEFFEIHRVYGAKLVARDAYEALRKAKNNNLIMFLGGDLHANFDCESVQLLEGKRICDKDNVFCSCFMDVWEQLCPNIHGTTERQTDVFNPDILLPRLVKPQRQTFFMVYGNRFGRIGTPLNIEINGNHTTTDGIPYSDDYGLTMNVWIPELNAKPVANN